MGLEKTLMVEKNKLWSGFSLDELFYVVVNKEAASNP